MAVEQEILDTITGNIAILYEDPAHTQCILPRTTTSAITDNNGEHLDVILNDLKKIPTPTFVIPEYTTIDESNNKQLLVEHLDYAHTSTQGSLTVPEDGFIIAEAHNENMSHDIDLSFKINGFSITQMYTRAPAMATLSSQLIPVKKGTLVEYTLNAQGYQKIFFLKKANV